LENNGRVDVFDHEGKSALHLAAEKGSIEVIDRYECMKDIKA